MNPLSPLSFYTTPNQAMSAASGNQNLAQSGINAQNAANNNANANTWNSISKLAGVAGGAIANQYNGTNNTGATDFSNPGAPNGGWVYSNPTN